MAVAERALTALELADQVREGRSSATAFRIWQVANRDLALYRHAMIHAGSLLTAKGAPYKRCPMCHHALK